MPEFRFYATNEEAPEMLRALFARGDLRVIVGRQSFAEPSAKTYTAFNTELAREVSKATRAHLFGGFSTHPPLFTKLTDEDEAGRYVLGDAGGGPAVLMLLPGFVDGVLVDGSLWTQPHYQLTVDQFSWPTPALKAAHADMVKRMKIHLVRWEGLWISPGALQLLKEGKAELPGTLKRLGVLLRKAKDLPQLGPAVPVTSKKTTKRKIAAKTATP